MSYREIHERAEAVLLAMVAEGRAEHAGVGPDGPMFRAEQEEAMQAMEDAGLFGDDVPWPHTVKACLRLCVEPTP